MTAADRWASALAGWAIPPEILEQAPESPWRLSPDCFVAEANPSTDATTRRGRDLLRRAGPHPTVLDVGCGGGRSSLDLAPPAVELIGVDISPAMLDRFRLEAAARQVRAVTVQGPWMDVQEVVADADLVICAQVLYNVADVVPFLEALASHARVGVVIELDAVHPMVKTSAAWKHFWDLDRPSGPTVDDLRQVLGEMGIVPGVETSQVPDHKGAITAADVERTRRRICLSPAHDGDIAAFMSQQPRLPRSLATLWWTT